jgi:tetratricopeptide (TPR) repeat protein
MKANKTKTVNYTYLILAIVFFFAWAFFWAMDGVLAYVLFGCATFFLVFYFYQRIKRQDLEQDHLEKIAQRFTVSHQTKTDVSTGASNDQKVRHLEVKSIFVITILVVTFILIVWSFLGNEGDNFTDQSHWNYEKANHFYRNSQFDSAYFYYRQSLRNNDSPEESLLAIGNTLYMKDDVDSAKFYYEIALKRNPSYSQARYNLGWWYYQQKQFQIAIKELTILVKRDSTQVEALQLIGDSFYESNQYDSALRWYSQSYDKGLRSRWLCHVLGYLHERNNRLNEAIILYKEAIAYDSSFVDLYIRLGELLPGTEGEEFRYKAAQLQLLSKN